MPDLDLVTAEGPVRVFTLLHDARPCSSISAHPAAPASDLIPWADRVRSVEAKYDGAWELPALRAVTPPTAVLIRPDGYVAWVGERTRAGLTGRADDLVRAADRRIASPAKPAIIISQVTASGTPSAARMRTPNVSLGSTLATCQATGSTELKA